MANHYVQFSVAFRIQNDEERKWCDGHLSLADRIFKSCDEHAMEMEEHPMFQELEQLVADYKLEEYDEHIGFDFEIRHGEIFIFAEESGNPDNAALFVQKFLQKFDQKSGVGFSYCTSCDKMRPNEFGGGAFFVTADEIKHIDVFQWVDDRRFEHGRDKSR